MKKYQVTVKHKHTNCIVMSIIEFSTPRISGQVFEAFIDRAMYELGCTDKRYLLIKIKKYIEK